MWGVAGLLTAWEKWQVQKKKSDLAEASQLQLGSLAGAILVNPMVYTIHTTSESYKIECPEHNITRPAMGGSQVFLTDVERSAKKQPDITSLG